jgi:lipopolysaccharide export LptBFGC system permease protein LptF
MPALLYRYILSDLLRTFVLTAGILVVVIAFAATLKPLTSDSLMTMGDTLKYMVLAIVPMLQFALPFAAGFASTMVLHRMTADNEIVAAAASGISYRRILMPIAATGLVLMLVMIGLTQWAIPRFWSLMERIVAADITRMFEASIRSGAAFALPGSDLQIRADAIRVVDSPAESDADTRFVLSRVTAAELDGAGRIDTDVTARQAVVDIYRRAEGTFLKLVMLDAVVYDGSTGQLAQSDRIEPPRAIAVPSLFRDELRAKPREELLRLRENPDSHSGIAAEKLRLAHALSRERTMAHVEATLREHGELELVQEGPSRRAYRIRADRMRGGELLRARGEPIELVQFESGAAVRRITAQRVALSRVAGGPDASGVLQTPWFEITLYGSEVTDLQSGTVNRRERLVDHGLALPGLGAEDLADRSSEELLAMASESGGDARRIAGQLEARIEALHHEIRARLWHRYSQSATAPLLLVLGATLAMLLRGSLPLFIYVWAFAPSVLALILSSGGDKIMRDGDILAGAAVMWSGNAAMLLVLLVSYLRLMRN